MFLRGISISCEIVEVYRLTIFASDFIMDKFWIAVISLKFMTKHSFSLKKSCWIEIYNTLSGSKVGSSSWIHKGRLSEPLTLKVTNSSSVKRSCAVNSSCNETTADSCCRWLGRIVIKHSLSFSSRVIYLDSSWWLSSKLRMWAASHSMKSLVC